MRFFVMIFAVVCLICCSVPAFACIEDAQRNEEILAYDYIINL